MMNEEKVNNFLVGTGALAEACMIFYDACIEKGFEEIQALKLTQTYLDALLKGITK